MAWRGVAWRGVAWRGVAWRGRQTDRLGLADIGITPPAGGPANHRAGAAQDAGGPQGPPAALRRATASTCRAPHYHDVTRMIMMMIRQLETDTHADRHTDSDRHHRVRRLLIIEGQSKNLNSFVGTLCRIKIKSETTFDRPKRFVN